MGTTAEKLQAVLDSKSAIKEALQGKGKEPTDVLSTYAGLIEDITDVTFADPLKLTDVWQFSGHSNTIRAIAVTADGYSYSGGNDKVLRKLTPDGTEVWSFTEHTNWIYGIALDEDGYVYTAGGDKRIFKLNPDGTKAAEYMHTISIYDIKVGPDGFIYTACAGGGVLKLTKSLTLEKKLSPHSIDANSVAVGPDEYIYTGSTDGNIRKTSQDGTQIWNFDGDAGAVKYIALDRSGCIYGVYANGILIKIAPDGTEVWRVELEYTALKMDLDILGNIYVAGYSGYIIKLNPDDGAVIWTHRPHTSSINALAVGDDGYIYSGGGSRLKKTHHYVAVEGTAYVKPASGKPIPQNIIQVKETQTIYAVDGDQIIPAGTFLAGDIVFNTESPQVTYALTNADGTQRAYAVLESEAPVTLTATNNDIRSGTTAITNTGYTEGTKDIPAYYSGCGEVFVQAGATAIINDLEYDYKYLMVTMAPFNTSVSESTAVKYVSVENAMYEANATEKLADITIDTVNQQVNLGIIAEELSVLRYFIVREEA